MNDAKSGISEAQSYHELGEFWDTHDFANFWDQAEPVEFQIENSSQTIYYPVETTLSAQLRITAFQRGISAETLLNLWIQEKMASSMNTTIEVSDS